MPDHGWDIHEFFDGTFDEPIEVNGRTFQGIWIEPDTTDDDMVGSRPAVAFPIDVLPAATELGHHIYRGTGLDKTRYVIRQIKPQWPGHVLLVVDLGDD